MMHFAKALTAFGLALGLVTATALAEEAPDFKLHSGTFAVEPGGFVVSGDGTGMIRSVAEYEPGQYVLTAEYKTENMTALSKVATDVLAHDAKTAMSAYEFTSATPEWSPLVLYVNIETKSNVVLRVGNWVKCNGAASKVHVRNLKLKPQEWVDGANLLVDGDLKSSTMDYLPVNWYWKPGKSKDVMPGVSYSVMQDAVTAKNTIHLVMPMMEEEVMLNGRSFNLPKAGSLEFSFSARSSKECTIIPRIVQSWTAQYTMQKHQIGTEWKTYTVNYTVVPDPKRKFFFVRFDLLPKQEFALDIADIKLIYHAPAAAPTTAPAK